MEDIFEELAAVSDDEGRAEENEQGGSGNRDDEAEEANDTRRVVKPKRVIARQPRPKLDPTRLLGPRGIFTIKSTFDNIKFKGKGHELDDLNNVLSRLQHWAHRLFPKMTFEDCIDRIEELGNKKQIQTNMHKIRNGMIDLDSGQPSQEDGVADNDRVPTPPPEESAFDQLMAAAPTALQNTLTDEQRARMMRNRLLAEERRMARRLAREKELEEQRRAGNKAAEESINATAGTSTIVASDGSVSADAAVSPAHDIPGFSSSEALKSADSPIGSKTDLPSCVFDGSALEPHFAPDLSLAAAAGGEEETRVLCSDSYAAGTSDHLSNVHRRSPDPKRVLLDTAVGQCTATIINTADSGAGEEKATVSCNDSSPSNADVSDGKNIQQDTTVAPLESSPTSPTTSSAFTAATAMVVCSSSPSKANLGRHQDHLTTIPESRLQVSESDFMDVEHTPEPSFSSEAASSRSAEDRPVQSCGDKNQSPPGQSQAPKPPTAVVDELMDVGSAEDWAEAFAEEERAPASQNQRNISF